MTGTSLHDLPRTIAGYEMYERAAKPNGAAHVMKTEHWRYRKRSDDREKVAECLCGWCAAPLVVEPFPFCNADPFGDCAFVDVSGGSNPRVCKRVSFDLRRSIIYINAESELRALWQVFMNSGERNLSAVDPSNDLNGTDTEKWSVSPRVSEQPGHEHTSFLCYCP